jgi:hypothetical protein
MKFKTEKERVNMRDDIYDKFIQKLIEINNENVTQKEHDLLLVKFRSWKEGLKDAGFDYLLNGDYYYIEKIDSGEMEERPMCAGQFLDWKSNLEVIK